MPGLNGKRSERILVVDDEESSREFCRLALAGSDREIVLCPDAEQALEEIRRTPFDLVLTDMVMPGYSGMELLEQLKAERSDVPVLLMSGKGSISMAVKAMRLGAEDFIEKPLPDPDVLLMAVNRALRARRLEEENRHLRQELQRLKVQPHLMGGSAISSVLRTLERIAPLDLTVLITGETGTGKEVFARRLHALSPRSSKPFIALNCGGIPHGLLESLLFGHERGAFTGAVRRTAGYFEKAHQGTILLDEIGDMPLSLQVKLLRVLQEKSFQRVGGETLIETDCRVLASTHRDLQQMIREGHFREDLYYRLNVLHLHIPPLRERRDDLPALAQHFLKIVSARLSKMVFSISPEAMECLKGHPWPGNARELENIMERAIALCGGEQIEVSDLPADFRTEPKTMPWPAEEMIPYPQAREGFERDYFSSLLNQSGGNVTRAAKICGLPRQNLYLKLNKYGITPAHTRKKASA